MDLTNEVWPTRTAVSLLPSDFVTAPPELPLPFPTQDAFGIVMN